MAADRRDAHLRTHTVSSRRLWKVQYTISGRLDKDAAIHCSMAFNWGSPPNTPHPQLPVTTGRRRACRNSAHCDVGALCPGKDA